MDKRNKIDIDDYETLKQQGLTDAQIAKGFGMTMNEFRGAKSVAKSQKRAADISMAEELRDKGYSHQAIGDRMGGIPESTVRTLLAPGARDKADNLESVTKMLTDSVDRNNGFIDVGSGVENQAGVGRNKLDVAIQAARAKGYELHRVSVRQVATGKDTNMKVLCPPGTTQKEVFMNKDRIEQMSRFSDDGGRTSYGLHEPIKIDPKRVGVVYGPDGGGKLDGVIYLRRNVPDLSLGGNNYGQVRISVGENSFLKGMAMYNDDMPKGVDILFHTPKESTGNKLDVMKPTEEDINNPFGSIVRQIVEHPGTPQEKVISAMNIVGGKTSDPTSGNVEGKWETWSKSLSSQILSKQSPILAKTQLDMTYEERKANYDDISALTNPVVKKKLLKTFSDSADAASVHLRAAQLPRQASRVILPIPSMPNNQVYAPQFRNGETVVLIRHPHGGTFEIPELTVNNKHPDAVRLLGDTRDAIGINHVVAKHLSGADFDGDAVIVIPNHPRRIKVSKQLDDLKDFDPIKSYPYTPGTKLLKKENVNNQMGVISNLITDMTLRDAPPEHMARAIKHSMVIIDAHKHKLNYTLSANENGIAELKKKYQTGGASTLISRARSAQFVPHRIERPHAQGGPINKRTGRLEFVPTGKPNFRTGKPRQTRTTRLAEATDALKLSSGTAMERIYAEHSNRLKALANQARLDMIKIKTPKQSSSAKKVYKAEVESLNAKLAIAVANRPLERQAQLIANKTIRQAKMDNPHMDRDVEKKIVFQAQEAARRNMDAQRHEIVITPKEWEAIQHGAISASKLTQILDRADMEKVFELATPKNKVLMTDTKIARAQQMLASGYTRSEVADRMGVSTSTLDKSLHGGG